MIGKLLKLGVVAAALVGADLGARAYAEGKVQERAEASLPGVEVHSSVSSFPFLPRLLLEGRVAEVNFDLNGVDGGRLKLANVDIDLNGVRLDRSALLQERRAQVDRIDRGTVAVELTATDLSAALGRPVRIAAGEVSVDVNGRLIATRVAAEGSSLTLGGGGLALTVPLPKLDLVPCYSKVTVLSGRLRISCSVDEIPAGLLDAGD